MKPHHWNLRPAGLLAAVSLLAATPAPAPAFLTERIVLIVIDGVRATEFLEHPTHAYIPRIWNELRPQGYVLHGLYNFDRTQTVSGHATITTGTVQDLPNEGTDRPTRPALWEYYRQATGAPPASCVISTYKDKLLVLSHSSYPGYGAPDSARIIGPTYNDSNSTALWKADALANQPTVSLLCLGYTDLTGHSGDWEAYTGAIATADTLVAHVWNWIESTPGWAGKTTLLVTADHGRHSDNWVEHGDACTGCRHLFLVALGPDIAVGLEQSWPIAVQRDVAETAAALLGIPAPLSEGRVLTQMLRDPSQVPQAFAAVEGWRLRIAPLPSSGAVRVSLRTGTADPEAADPGGAAWRLSLVDATGRTHWTGRSSLERLRQGEWIERPATLAGAASAWLRVQGPDGTASAERIVWIR